MEENKEILTLDDIYFKDCFTETGDGINAEFNELKAKCLSSTTGNFRIDSMGNITCNSVLTTSESSTGNTDFDAIYPVGSIYFTANNINPSTLFGGTWERFAKGRTLVGIDEDDTDFNELEKTGGEKNHKLTIDEMPSHLHDEIIDDTGNPVPYTLLGGKGNGTSAGKFFSGTRYNYTGENVGKTGGNKEHNNMPPYLAVYIWKRTA